MWGGVEVLLHPLWTLVLGGGQWSSLCPGLFAPWDQTVVVSTVKIETTWFYSYMKYFSQLKSYTFGSFICSPELVEDNAALFTVCSLQILVLCSLANLWQGRQALRRTSFVVGRPWGFALHAVIEHCLLSLNKLAHVLCYKCFPL